jgi:hypothetical protein
MAKWGIWFFVIGRRTLTPDLGENGVKTLVCVCVCDDNSPGRFFPKMSFNCHNGRYSINTFLCYAASTTVYSC